jgi:hypothetical protein
MAIFLVILRAYRGRSWEQSATPWRFPASEISSRLPGHLQMSASIRLIKAIGGGWQPSA